MCRPFYVQEAKTLSKLGLEADFQVFKVDFYVKEAKILSKLGLGGFKIFCSKLHTVYSLFSCKDFLVFICYI